MSAQARTSYPEVHAPAEPTGLDPVVLLHGGNVANWMWDPQVSALRDRLVLTPHLPGFGDRVAESWPGLDGAADDVVRRVRSLGVDGPFHLVGLSLGGVTALRVAARHQDALRSALVTGASVLPVGAATRVAASLQLALWDAPWYWRVQAHAFGLPADSHEPYVSHGLSVRRETAKAMFADVYAGGIADGLRDYRHPMLAIAGEREPAVIRRSIEALRTTVPHVETRLAPGMHHIWNIEDIELFDATLRTWLDGVVEPRLLPG